MRGRGGGEGRSAATGRKPWPGDRANLAGGRRDGRMRAFSSASRDESLLIPPSATYDASIGYEERCRPGRPAGPCRPDSAVLRGIEAVPGAADRRDQRRLARPVDLAAEVADVDVDQV